MSRSSRQWPSQQLPRLISVNIGEPLERAAFPFGAIMWSAEAIDEQR